MVRIFSLALVTVALAVPSTGVAAPAAATTLVVQIVDSQPGAAPRRQEVSLPLPSRSPTRLETKTEDDDLEIALSRDARDDALDISIQRRTHGGAARTSFHVRASLRMAAGARAVLARRSSTRGGAVEVSVQTR